MSTLVSAFVQSNNLTVPLGSALCFQERFSAPKFSPASGPIPGFSIVSYPGSTGFQTCASRALPICWSGHDWKGEMEKKFVPHLTWLPLWSFCLEPEIPLYWQEQEVYDLDILGGWGASLLPELMPLLLHLKALSKGPVSVLFSTFSERMSPHLPALHRYKMPCTLGRHGEL